MESVPTSALIGAIIALATVIGYVFKRLFDDGQGAAKATREAYFDHVTRSTVAITESTLAMKDLREAIREGREQSAREHEGICDRLNGTASRR